MRASAVSAQVQLAGLALMLAWQSEAAAAPLEQFAAVAVHPDVPDTLVLSYDNGGQGLLVSQDGGSSFQLVCSAAVTESFGRASPIQVTGSGNILVGTFVGMAVGQSGSCAFKIDPMAEMGRAQAAAFAPHPSDSSITFVVTANPTTGARTGLVQLTSDGSVTPLGSNDTGESGRAEFFANQLRVVERPDAPLLFFESGGLAVDEEGNYEPVVRRSEDMGNRWTTTQVFGAERSIVELVAVDTGAPERWLVVVHRDKQADEIMLTEDAGETYTLYLQVHSLGGAAFDSDRRLWLGDRGGENDIRNPGGLWRAERLGAPPVALSKTSIFCLAHDAPRDRMVACQRASYGEVDKATGAFTEELHFATVRDFAACEGSDLAAVCEPQLCENWCGVSHYPYAPLCDAYDSQMPLCGPSARGNSAVDLNPEGREQSLTMTAVSVSSGVGRPAVGPATSESEGSSPDNKDTGTLKSATPQSTDGAVPAAKGGCATQPSLADRSSPALLLLALAFSRLRAFRRRGAAPSLCETARSSGVAPPLDRGSARGS